MPHWPKLLELRPAKVSLEPIREALGMLGNPEEKIPPAIHVSGTNGKGSTIAFLASILNAAGLKVHTYTSPHLVEFNERIVLNGTKISDTYLYEILEECRIATDSIPLTFFEATTVAALLAFSRVPADIALIEVGMGGRLDATNVITPILSIITSVSLDHTKFLGSTVELIAGEKSGILKKGVSCVVGRQMHDTVMRTIEYHGSVVGAPLYRGGIEWFCEKAEDHMLFKSGDEYKFPLPSLIGRHQIDNAGNAIAACSILSGKYGYEVGYEDIAEGVTCAKWRARLEQITSGAFYKMLPPGWKLFLDGAHNSSGAAALSNWVSDYIGQKVYVIVGLTKDRNARDFLSHLRENIRFLCAVCVKSEYLAQPAEDILEAAIELGIDATAEENLKSAICRIIAKGHSEDEATIVICGSLFLAGDLLKESLLEE